MHKANLAGNEYEFVFLFFVFCCLFAYDLCQCNNLLKAFALRGNCILTATVFDESDHWIKNRRIYYCFAELIMNAFYIQLWHPLISSGFFMHCT